MRHLFTRLLQLTLTCIFVNASSLNAFTQEEMEEYRLLCKKAAQDAYTYNHLRQEPLHRKIVEPFPKTNLSSYCLQIQRETLFPKALTAHLKKLEKKLNGPEEVSLLALRHCQIGIELEREFGLLKDLRILQIGSGFGHLAAHLASTTGFKTYTLLDYPECLSLQKKFLSSCGLNHLTYLTPSQLSLLDQNAYDLVLCTFPFTEWGDDTLRETLLQKIALFPRGYITCHAPWHPLRTDDAIEDHLLLHLARAGHRVYAAPERGDPSPAHSVIRWGTQETPAPDLLTPSQSKQPENAIVIEAWGDRMGDHLMKYARAKWISHRYGIPILVRPFPNVEGFALSKRYPILSPHFCYDHEVHPKNHRELTQALSKPLPSTLFVMDFFAETDFEIGYYAHTGAYFYTNWRDRGFLKALREDLAPIVPIEKPMLDDSDIHLAVHLRLGSGYDAPGVLQIPAHALKAPLHSFYQQQITRIATLFPDRSIQVHLFTDDPDPKLIAQQYAETLNNPRLHFTYRTEQNRHDMHVLDDFFAMSAYDCLIHPRSYFSSVAAQLGDFAVRITPTHASLDGEQWVVDRVDCAMDGTHPLFKEKENHQ